MGICSSTDKGNKKQEQKSKGNENNQQNMPQVTEKDRQIKRTFTVILSNLKIKNPPQRAGASLHLNFDTQCKHQLSLTEVDNSLRWKQQLEFEYTVDDYRLKSLAFVNFSLKNSSEQDLGNIVLKLYKVATGPYHHDMAIMWKNNINPQKMAQMKALNIPIHQHTEGRISFDLKMFQKIEFCISTDSIISNLETFTDKAYNFSLRLITHNNTYNSEHSDFFLNPAFQKADDKMQTDSQDEKNSRISFKNGKLKDQEQDKDKDKQREKANTAATPADENFTQEMNENVDVIKIKSKLIKPKKDMTDSITIESPTKKKNTYVLNQANEGRKLVPTLSFTKQESQKLARLASLKKVPGSGKLDSSNDEKENTDIVNEELTGANTEKQSIDNEEQILQWDYSSQDNSQDGPEPPELIVKLTTKDLATTSLQICFWGLLSTDPLEKIDETGKVIKYFDNHIAGECYISLNRIFAVDPEIIEIKGQKVQVRKKAINEKLWNHGKEVGTTKSNFKVINHEYLQQMIVGVQTENGVLKASPAVYDFKEGTGNNADIVALNEAKNILNDSVFTLYEKKQILEQKDKDKIKQEINQSFQTVFELAQKSHKESIKSFYYKSQEELLQSQDILIDVAKHLSQYADEVDEYLRDNYYDCLKIIINRGEFDLNYMGFDESYHFLLETAQGAQLKKTGFNKEAIRKLNLKMKVALSYQKLLYSILEKVLDKLNQKALSDKERQFVENYCAVAYFRIPEFRQKLLSVVIKSDDIEITEWRGTEYQLDETKNNKLAKNNEFISLFDWEQSFYRFLKTQERGEQHFNDLSAILNDTKWSYRMSKRGVAFFFFLTEWLQYVNKTVVVKDHVPWQDLPGYLTLLRAFLIELKSRDILQYPEALKLASQSILNNERLLNILITLIYNKTNVYDSNKTVQTFDLINSWMQFLIQNNKNIPTVFDFSFFLKGIRTVLDQDHSICLARVIWVIYNNFTLFPPDFQKEICEYLFSNLFFRLFMHWSYNVRMIFQYFLIYRINHLFGEQKTKYKGIDELKRQILNNTNFSERKFALINDIIHLMYNKMMNIVDLARAKYASQETQFQEQQKFHLKMRQKLIEKQENKLFSKNNQSNPNNSYSILEVSFSQEKERIQEEMHTQNNILDDLDNDKKDSVHEEIAKPVEKDMIFDSFENYEIQQIQRAQSTITQIKVHLKRSNSVVQAAQVIQKEDTQFEYDNQYDIANFQRQKSSRSNSVNYQQMKKSDSIKDANKQKVVIYNRRVGYQVDDKKDDTLVQIEKQYIKYIVQSCYEFEQLKKSYQKWYSQQASKLPAMSKERRQAHARKFIIPEVILKATIDEAESSYSQMDEW
ncbi:hypothetical protein TTHERM_00112530 (macronuclear) [Tetrahymena thermophila SB210]|uniref:C2 domain protein n=1 Tax=Tetrahymena thermophila (strain SB210) TaxID=312017 RepID=Q22ZB8_TETTS|nr:hypothetical protein TTHERM_00112530 [Tetrahymena thermophila SB210]EAR90403.2 hypothetical protein TTHERM_00112530 [Tetrahymena thermophila SB210]|eukprot:XP_001010648.2 hypothetical protein TTHERM_00112530 [Tetrahymena thermophila SB210]